MLYQRGVPPQATYLFKHALIQEAAYQSLLRSTRQQYHQRIAQVLAERSFPTTAETQPELLAHHYTEAGLQAQALPYWQQAGQRAIERSAYVEARQHLTTGLEVLATVPETPARHQHELDLLTALAQVLGVTKGQAAPELEPVLTRAEVLAQQVGEPSATFRGAVCAVRFQPRRKTLTSRRRVARRVRGGSGTRAVTSGTVLAGIVSSASPPTLSSHKVATATASHRRAARSGLVMWVRCHCQPARLVILKPCSIQARNPYQQAVLASGGRSVRINHGSL